MGLSPIHAKMILAAREALSKQKADESALEDQRKDVKNEDVKKADVKKSTGSSTTAAAKTSQPAKASAPPPRNLTSEADVKLKQIPFRQAIEFGNEAMKFVRDKIAAKLQDPDSKLAQEMKEALSTAFAGMSQVTKRGEHMGAKIKNFDQITKFAQAKFGKNPHISQKSLRTAEKILEIMAGEGLV